MLRNINRIIHILLYWITKNILRDYNKSIINTLNKFMKFLNLLFNV